MPILPVSMSQVSMPFGWVRARAVLLLAAPLVVLLLTALPQAARAQDALRGVALVVGQSQYRHLTALPNPGNDADALDELLSDLGFEVTGVSNADQKRLARALERFVEDAEDADVALIYYSGHGIEAGGENFLVPVDADIAALDEAGTRLVPISGLMARLQRTVPVTIVLLDACRDNPFPAGATVRLEAGAAPVAVSAAGLSAPRGASPMAAPMAASSAAAAPATDLGALIGFAAAPGRVALDGEPGGNSPYAGALIKHLSAGGYAFADVMTMVSEEVWLKTRAAQTPWTNTSLRRQLFFGAAPEDDADADEAAIRGERRGLLLKIAALGQAERQQVAARADEGGVPMDALFAMLAAVGAEAPGDPAELDALLKQQAERLRAILDDRAVLTSTDAELVRLAALTDQAIGEGALQSAISLNERAKARVGELSARIDDVEAEIGRRRAEFAAVYARSAKTYELAGDHGAAADDYRRAFEEVRRWDGALAWQYRTGEAAALGSLGHYGGDNGALDRAVETWRDAMAYAPRGERPAEWARTQAGLGAALWSRGDRLGDDADTEAAIVALEAAIAGIDRAADPEAWAEAHSSLGAVMLTSGMKQTGGDRLARGEAVLRAAAEVRTRAAAPAEWARIQNRLGLAVYMQGARDPDGARIAEALPYFDASLEERPRERVPMDWAQSQSNRALALSALGQRSGNLAQMTAAVDAYRDVLTIYTRERTPMLWAESQANLGNLLWILSARESGTDLPIQSAEAFRQALEVITREQSPPRWAALKDNLGLSLKMIGERRADELMVEEALGHYREALEERPRERVPLEWAGTTGNLANGLYTLGYHRRDAAMLEEAVRLWEATLEINTRASFALDWARTTNNLGIALHAIGTLATDAAALDRAVEYFRMSLLENTRERVPVDWALTQVNLARVLLDLGRHRSDRAVLAQALEATLGAREAYLAAGIDAYASSFDALELEIRMADLQALLNEKMKELEAQDGSAQPKN